MSKSRTAVAIIIWVQGKTATVGYVPSGSHFLSCLFPLFPVRLRTGRDVVPVCMHGPL